MYGSAPATGSLDTAWSAAWRFARWELYHFVRMANWRLRSATGDWILGRHACLGGDVRKLIAGDVPVLNLQKCRADYLVDAFACPSMRARTWKVAPYMSKREILSMIAAQEQPYWAFLEAPRAIYMDSFSELTDQLYQSGDGGWRFCSNHSDLDHSGDFAEHFSSLGLLPDHQILQRYDELFGLFSRTFGPIPILFLHFPSKLEKREKFIDRAKAIRESIDSLKQKYGNLHSFSVPVDCVDWPTERDADTENFPYHYNEQTYRTIEAAIGDGGLDALFHARRGRPIRDDKRLQKLTEFND